MKVLLIEDDANVAKNVEESFKTIEVDCIVFQPASDGFEEIFTQLKELCKAEKFDIAILDYSLWYLDGQYLTGNLLIQILNYFEIKTIAFSSIDNHNSTLIRFGAISAINKGRLYKKGERPVFDQEKFINLFKEALKL